MNENQIMDDPNAEKQGEIGIPPTQKSSNGIGIAGFILALLALLLSVPTLLSVWYPILWIPTLICWLLGLIFSCIGLARRPKGLAIAGLIISGGPLIALIGGFVIYQQISTPIKFEQELATRKAAVIERIKDIRTAERAFKSKYQRFTGDFDSLEQFILNDTLVLERKIAVIDTIFSPRKLTAADVKQLRYIPFGEGKEYYLEAGLITTESKMVIPIVECRAPYKLFMTEEEYKQELINLIDDQVNNFNNYAGVKFGSMEGANNETGNWED